MLPVCKKRNHSHVDSHLADKKHGEKQLEFIIKPPFPLVQKPTLKQLGLPRKKFYGPTEVAKAIGDHRDVMRKRLLAGYTRSLKPELETDPEGLPPEK